jgi:hypothetical protein
MFADQQVEHGLRWPLVDGVGKNSRQEGRAREQGLRVALRMKTNLGLGNAYVRTVPHTRIQKK